MFKNSLFFALFLLFSSSVFGQHKKDGDQVYATKSGAIQGYDPVAYFTDGKAVEGKQGITFQWQDAEWHFTSEEHKTLFSENPEQYAPQYGGYCAYGWTKGYAAKIDPLAWSIVDNKLYLNYNADVQNLWNEKQSEYIQIANENYSKKHDKN
jgi:YHS domain-containing protein